LFLNAVDGGCDRRVQQGRRRKKQKDKGGGPPSIGPEQKESAGCYQNNGHNNQVSGHQQTFPLPVPPTLEKFPQNNRRDTIQSDHGPKDFRNYRHSTPSTHSARRLHLLDPM
jgi:hypothetical protein